MKKVFTFFGVMLLMVLLVACGDKEYSVTFDSNYEGAPAAKVVKVTEGKKVDAPADPTRVDYDFLGWFLDGELYDFDEVVTKNLTLKAKWEETAQVVRFIDHRSGNVEVVEVEPGDEVAAPVPPRRTGFVFSGWYKTKAGKVWDEVEAQEFPFEVEGEESIEFYAYWEPVNSKTVNWTDAETYVSAMVRPDRIVINPLEYRWSHENDFIDMLVAPMYSTEVDWYQAIEDGVADYPGDFSKIESNEYSIEAFDYHYILIGAAEYPVNENGDSAVREDGSFDRDVAKEITGKEWTFVVRDDLVFEDGTPIDATTFEFTLKQWLDPEQNTYRANMWYKNEENTNGRPLLNAEEYLNGEVTWDDVGFKLGEPNAEGRIYSFTVITWEEIRLSDAVSLANAIRLVHPAKYLASIDPASGFSQYGTPSHLFSSYGPYVIKQWDANARLVFNKNYDYVKKETINYKSQVIEIVADTAEAYNLFKKGDTSVLGLNKEYYAEYAEDPGVKDSWGGYPQYMIINQAVSQFSGERKHEHPTILGDQRFRQALLFGFDRKEFAYNIYAPNKPAPLPIPSNTVHYLYDPLYYTETEQHREVIEGLGFEIEDYLFGPERAKALFEEAYADWIADGNSGPITLRYVSDDDDFSISLDNYIKESYENLFEDENGNKRVIIDIKNYDGTGLEDQIKNHNFDLTLTSLGFGASVEAFWQYAAIALYPALIGASGFGLYYPYVEEDGENVIAEYTDWEIEVDFTNTFNFIKAKDQDNLKETEKDFLELLDEDGIYRGTVHDIAMYILSDPTVFTSAPKEPFLGASEDLSNLVAAWEKVFFEYVPVVPTVTRSSSTIYAANVHIEWPKYSDAFGWGAARYRYLTSDPDFADRAK